MHAVHLARLRRVQVKAKCGACGVDRDRLRLRRRVGEQAGVSASELVARVAARVFSGAAGKERAAAKVMCVNPVSDFGARNEHQEEA